MTDRALAIGWDVGGWLGNKQAVAAIELREDGTWRHVGAPVRFRVAVLGDGGVFALIRTAWTDAPSDIVTTHRITIAIDAPLSFPDAFCRLLSGEAHDAPKSKREIENAFAYRDCDRWVRTEHGKKPLSASFDKLGNNATVAMVMTRRWRDRESFRLLPLDTRTDQRREIIETYPALLKREGVVVHGAHELLPDGLTAGSDEQDAAVCAVVALAHLGVDDARLPPLVTPQADQARDGWIYAPSRAWVDAADRCPS